MSPGILYLSGIEAYPDYIPTEISIGGQVWDQKNLNTARYRDGAAIPSSTTWIGATTGIWRYYDNIRTNGPIYGRLYNWYAAMGIWDAASLADPLLRKNIAPAGWRVATEADWSQLASYVNSLTPVGTVGNKLREIGTSYWTFFSGASGTDLVSFKARGAGQKGGDGIFSSLKARAAWWTATASNTVARYIDYNNTALLTSTGVSANVGWSVRLIKEDIIIPGFTITAASNIAVTSVTSGATFSDLPSTPSLSDKGLCYGTSASPNIVFNSFISAGSGTTPNPYSINITGLTPGTTYYIRAYAVLSDGSGVAYSTTTVSFATLSGLPILTTTSISSITSSSAISGGNITDDRGFAISARGVCWNTTGSPTTLDSKTTDGTGTGSFTSNMTSLFSDSTYYVRAYATNSVGTSYGNEISFNTLVAVPILDLYPTSINHAYSLRKLKTSYSGFCLRVRRATTTPSITTTIVDLSFDSNNTISLNSPITFVSGTATVATNLGQFCASIVQGYANPDGVNINQSIFVVTWFDQSGNGKNPTQATPGNQPRLVAGGNLETKDSKVAVRFTKSASQVLLIADSSININNISIYFVGAYVSTVTLNTGYRLAGATNNLYLPNSNGFNAYLGYGTNSSLLQLGSVTTNRRLYEALAPSPITSTLISAWTNGASMGGVSLINSTVTSILLGGGGTVSFDGYIQEVLGWQTNANRVEKEANINSYWKIY